MFFELDPHSIAFPNPELSEPDGLLAEGGDLSPQRLINAYCHGIFPWYNSGSPILWWSLNPRMVLYPNEFRYSKSLHRVVDSGKFEVRIDTCFEQVMRLCGATREDYGTGITEEMVEAYVNLHNIGVAHSFETFCGNELVGGLYGVSLGTVFCGESMFHTVTDASKVAFVRLVEFCNLHGLNLIDAQQETSHLASLGAHPIPRKKFLNILQTMDFGKTIINSWNANTVVLLLGGNEGNRVETLKNASSRIQEEIGPIILKSHFYETEPWGFEAPTNFLNQAMVVDTQYSSQEVLERVLSIEKELGRVRVENAEKEASGSTRTYASRPMDIDLMFYNSQIINTPHLQIPHPRMHLRRFVLQPLCDIIPDFRHPILKQSICQLLKQCPDTGTVLKFSTSE